MSYIQPNSTIEFFSDLNLSQDYNDSLYFETSALRDIYFTNIPKLAVANRCYYARDNRGFVRVELPIGTMMHAQYMRFKNTSYENNWWYAFVKDVIYVNDNTVEVQFELDIFMSYMGEFTLNACFVERQHSEKDAIGDNLVDEGLALGEYVTEGYQVSGRFGNKKILVAMVPHASDPQQPFPWERGGMYGGIYSGLYLGYVNSVSDMNNVIDMLTRMNRIDELVYIQMMPSDFLCEFGSTSPKQYDLAVQKPYTDIDGYIPKNKKLFTYPYKYLSIYNCEGQSVDLKYEFFTPPTECNFYLRGMMSTDSTITCIPRMYMHEPLSVSNVLSMKSFPQCPWASDSYRAYLAQIQSSAPTNLLATSLPTAPGLAQVAGLMAQGFEFANPEAALVRMGTYALGMGAISGVNKLLASQIIPPTMPNKMHGSMSSDILYASNNKDFYFYKKSIRAEYAEMIDNYFTMFGYADRTVHVPNMNARTRFTYIKTIGCKLNCACPASDADFIEQLFNRGIRLWKNHLDIGNYTDTNAPNPAPNNS